MKSPFAHVHDAQALATCPSCAAAAGDPCVDRTAEGNAKFRIVAPHKGRK